jgi:hypothetical protein
VHVHAGGAADAYRMAERLGEAGKNLKRQLDRAGREAGKILADAVTDPASTDRYIPKGFEARFARSLQVKLEVRLAASRTVTVVVWANGKKYRRHLDRMNAGVLRHPVHGRQRRLKDGAVQINPWSEQTIRPGVIDEPAAEAMPRAVLRFHAAAQRVIDKINGG